LTTEATTEATARSRWLSILRWATYGLIAVPILITIVAQAVIPPLIVFLVLFIAGLIWLGRDERKGTIMLGVLALLFFAINVPFIVDALAHPESWTEFIPNVIGLLSAIAALAATTALLRNRGTEKAAATLVRVLAVVGIVAVVFSVIRTVGLESDTAQEGDVTLTAEDVEWNPEQLEVDGGGAVFVENKDLFRHTFTVEDLEINEDLGPGQDLRVELAADPGEYEFKCEVPGHEDMKGTLTVR